jgi:hypothetical protein
MPQQPKREARLAAWQQHGGLSNDEIQFFQRNPALVDYPQITGLAVAEANQAGHERGSAEHFAYVKQAFDAHLSRLQSQAERPTMPAPAFFRPPSAPVKSSNYSAPVSRGVPSASDVRPRGKVRLTPQEQEAARISGISLEQYAKEKLRYQDMLADGSYRDARETQR